MWVEAWSPEYGGSYDMGSDPLLAAVPQRGPRGEDSGVAERTGPQRGPRGEDSGVAERTGPQRGPRGEDPGVAERTGMNEAWAEPVGEAPWAPVAPAPGPLPATAFLDGVSRVEARV